MEPLRIALGTWPNFVTHEFVLIGNSLTGEFSRASTMRVRWPYVQRVVGAQLEAAGEQRPQVQRELQPEAGEEQREALGQAGREEQRVVGGVEVDGSRQGGVIRGAGVVVDDDGCHAPQELDDLRR